MRERRTADPLRRPAHRGAADRRDRPAAAGEAARRRPPAGRRDVLERAGRAGAVPADFAVRRAGRAAEVKVNRQVLAEPSADLAAHTWAALADGTPLVTEATEGAGRDRAVPRHRQRRLVQPAAVRPVRGHAAPAGRAVGRRGADRPGHAVLAPARDAGRVRPAVARRRQAATGLPADAFATTPPSRRAIRQGCTGRRTAGGR